MCSPEKAQGLSHGPIALFSGTRALFRRTGLDSGQQQPRRPRFNRVGMLCENPSRIFPGTGIIPLGKELKGLVVENRIGTERDPQNRRGTGRLRFSRKKRREEKKQDSRCPETRFPAMFKKAWTQNAPPRWLVVLRRDASVSPSISRSNTYAIHEKPGETGFGEERKQAGCHYNDVPRRGRSCQAWSGGIPSSRFNFSIRVVRLIPRKAAARVLFPEKRASAFSIMVRSSRRK